MDIQDPSPPWRLTLATAREGQLATKKLCIDGTLLSNYDKIRLWRFSLIAAQTFEAFCARIIESVVPYPNRCVLYGELVDRANFDGREWVRRLKRARDGVAATFKADAYTRVLALDIDDAKLTDLFDAPPPLTALLVGPVPLVRAIQGRLGFPPTAALCLFTASQKRSGEEARVRILLPLGRPYLVEAELRDRWAKPLRETHPEMRIDPSVFQVVQPIFLAAPVFVDTKGDPAPDILTQRATYIPGSGHASPVLAPEPVTRQLAARSVRRPPRPPQVATGEDFYAKYIGDHPGGLGSHEGLRTATLRGVREGQRQGTARRTLVPAVAARAWAAHQAATWTHRHGPVTYAEVLRITDGAYRLAVDDRVPLKNRRRKAPPLYPAEPPLALPAMFAASVEFFSDALAPAFARRRSNRVRFWRSLFDAPTPEECGIDLPRSDAAEDFTEFRCLA